MLEAVKANPKTGELIEDFETQLKAVQFLMKLKGFQSKEPEVVVNLFNANNQYYG